jgi:DNA-binding response OmpR family regulator
MLMSANPHIGADGPLWRPTSLTDLNISPPPNPIGRVLVVDDEPLICKWLAVWLTWDGYDVRIALNGETALDVVRGQHIDVMVIDLRVLDIRGDILFELVTSVQPHLRQHTVFITGDITDRANGLMAACYSPVLYKPFDPGELTNAIAGQMQRAPLSSSPLL